MKFETGVLYHRWGKLDVAEKSYLTALQLDPNNKQTVDNLELLKRRRKQWCWFVLRYLRVSVWHSGIPHLNSASVHSIVILAGIYWAKVAIQVVQIMQCTTGHELYWAHHQIIFTWVRSAVKFKVKLRQKYLNFYCEIGSFSYFLSVFNQLS